MGPIDAVRDALATLTVLVGTQGAALGMQGTAPAPLPIDHRLTPVPATDVRLRDDAFFAPSFRRNLEVTLRFGHEQLEKNGQFKNFRLAAGSESGDYCGVHFYDSDAYKWLEAASLALAYARDPELEAMVDRFIAEIAAAQEPDGYLQTQYTFKKQERWSNLADDHELYCAGHLIQAAIAHHAVTGKRSLYDVALKLADCIDRTFGPDQRPGCCGHPEIETALVELFRHNGERRWLDLAHFFLEERGQKPPRAGGDEYHQDSKPIREQTTATGHAVRQLYLCSGITGVAAETGDRTLFDAALAISRDIDANKLYLTGGVGARHDGEAFGKPFELPNLTAYAETCASIALMRFSREMVALTGDARFVDRLETTLYNGFLAATGLDGKSFFYVNPLESSGGRQRQGWFWCACCPPNIMRTFAGLPGWFASTRGDELYLHLYDNVDVATKLGDGSDVEFQVATRWPWNGTVEVTFTRAPARPMTLALRRPGWAKSHEVRLDDGSSVLPDVTEIHGAFAIALGDDGYLRVQGQFRAGMHVTFVVPADPQLATADARVADDVGKVALQRGPLVYAFESPDQPDVDLFATSLDTSAGFRCEPIVRCGRPVIGIGCSGVETRATAATSNSGDTLYDRHPPTDVTSRPVALTAIPYYLWANRGDSKMRIWMPILATATAAAAASAPAQQPAPLGRPEATFGNDVKFLAEHADVVVLQGAGAGPVAVSPKLTARVMTSAFSESDLGFGLVNRDAIAVPPVERGFNNFGGEDRLWLAPEGGPYGLYFDPGAAQTLPNWYVPLAMDGGPRTVASKDATSITFRDRVQLVNVKKVAFDLSIERKVEALSRAEIAKLLDQVTLPDGVKVVGVRTTNTVKNEAATALPDDALIAPWILGQFKPSAQNEVLLPFNGDATAVKKDYFGVVPDDRLKLTLLPELKGGVARFKADAQLRTKIGVAATAATGFIGAFDRARGVLTIVSYSQAASSDVVPDCNWIDPNPRARSGDIATSYNHGQEPRFFELESISKAMPTAAGGSVTHRHVTIHIGGDSAVLAKLAKIYLRADL